MMRALALVLVLALPADAYSLLDAPKSDLQRCYRRCERNNPPLPSPIPTQSPVPMQCENIGTGSTKTFTVGEERRMCFTTSAKGNPIVEVGTTNRGNASCADFWMQMYSPTGAVSEMSRGVQPGVVMMPRVAGKYYIAIGLTASNSTTCSTLTFTVR